MANSKALPILLGGAAVYAVAKSSKRKHSTSNRSRWGISISRDCSKVEVSDPKMFHQFINGGYDELISVDSSLSPLQISDAMFREVAPECSPFPEDPESVAVVELYAAIVRKVAVLMIMDDRIDSGAVKIYEDLTDNSFMDWYSAWKDYPTSHIESPPDKEVSFASDLSGYTIGENWFEGRVRPFVQDSYDEERLDTVLSDFMENRGVMVGQRIMPISDLPDDQEVVQRFIEELSAAIEKAKSEVFTG